VLANPYLAYARLREQSPVLWDRRFGWLIFRYEDVAQCAADPRLSARRPAPEDPIPRVLQPIAGEVREVRDLQGQWLLCADPPRHTRLRTVLGAAFSPRAVHRMRPRIQAIVDRVLDRAEADGGLDVIAVLAYPLPRLVGALSVLVGGGVLALGKAPRVLTALIAAMAVGLGTSLLVTLVWKISIHVAVVAGAVVILVLVFGRAALGLVPLVALVAWARVALKDHTPGQVVAGAALGAALGALVAASVFSLLR
jgi:membrane-associated phospholipid phosphatase